MNNNVKFCTCDSYDCPHHPSNHDQGCTPCIAKNLQLREIPSCFFNQVGGEKTSKTYFYEDFAEMVMKEK